MLLAVRVFNFTRCDSVLLLLRGLSGLLLLIDSLIYIK